MARSTPSRASDAPRDAVALLKQDHRTVEALFDQFEEAEESEQSQLAERICQLLTVHTQIEEEILYPAAKEAFSDDEEEEDMVYEAQVEHSSAKELIARIEGMTPDDETFKATVKVLSEYIKHHVKEEETEMFPSLKKAELDLKELGSQLQERKLALMEQLGIQEEQAPAQKKSSSRSSSRGTNSSKSRQARAGSRSKSSSRSGKSARH
jgi:hemerythrin-like domain-containing protein